MQGFFRNFAAIMFWNRKKEEQQGQKLADWPDAEWPAYVPKCHLHDFAAIDFEAANAELTSACSMGIVIVRGDAIADEFYSLMRPVPNYYDFWTTKVHGIRKRDTEHAPLFPNVWSRVEKKLRGLPLVAHGSLFDERVLKALHRHYNIRYPDFKFYCTHRGSEILLPDAESHKVQPLAKLFGYDHEQTKHHNALADAEACATIAMHIF